MALPEIPLEQQCLASTVDRVVVPGQERLLICRRPAFHQGVHRCPANIEWPSDITNQVHPAVARAIDILGGRLVALRRLPS